MTPRLAATPQGKKRQEYIIYEIKQKHTKHTTIYKIIQNRTKGKERMGIKETTI